MNEMEEQEVRQGAVQHVLGTGKVQEDTIESENCRGERNKDKRTWLSCLLENSSGMS